MTSEPRVILLEFNELSPAVMDKFMARGKLPNFQRLHDEAVVYTTDAQEQPPNLEPWIQWVTVHSGLPFRQHGVFHLGDGHKLRQKCIWDVLSDFQFRVAVCGSMNIRYDLPVNGYVLPDPWTFGIAPYPSALLPYYRFIQLNVQEYTNDRIPLSRTDYAKFVNFMATHGLSLGTVSSIVKQLASERGGKHRWKRAAILDKLQFDLFCWFHRKLKPHFSTFFVNSTAHLQHMHWRNMDPEPFKVKPTVREQEEYEEAILFGYQEMDKLVGGFLALADQNTTLAFCTALSQQPCLTYEASGGKTFYRPFDFDKFLAFAGVTAPYRVNPVMSEQFHIHFNSEGEACEAEQQLRGLQLGGRHVIFVERKASTIFSGCSIFDVVSRDSVLSAIASGKTSPFFEIFYRVEGMKSGMHHPDGMLWIRKPGQKHIVHNEKVPLTSIAPTILEIFGIHKPDYMRAESLKAIAQPYTS